MALKPNVPIVNAGYLDIQGMQLTFITTTTIRVFAGVCRDSTNTNDITLDNSVVLNTATAGLVNGLDTGTLAASTMYAVFAIGDSTEYQPSGSLMSLSNNAPLLPAGYDMFRYIGSIRTTAGSVIGDFTQTGQGVDREMYYSDAIATAVVAGASAVFAHVDLTTLHLVPVSAGNVVFLVTLTADAGGTRSLALRDVNSSSANGQAVITTPASEVDTEIMICRASLLAGIMTTDYKVSNAAAAVAINVMGYVDQINLVASGI